MRGFGPYSIDIWSPITLAVGALDGAGPDSPCYAVVVWFFGDEYHHRLPPSAARPFRPGNSGERVNFAARNEDFYGLGFLAMP